MRFASRTEFVSAGSQHGIALEQARASGRLLDLTVSNPTRCGFVYPADRLLAALGDPAVLAYEADPLGMRSAREAISALYRDSYQASVPPEHLLLTASTSEAYSYLLRLFCEPGDAILVPSPSYPLFDLLARLHDVEVVTYPLVYHDGWQVDPASLAAAVTPRTRAVVAIHPNNPTGHYCSVADRGVLRSLAQKHGLPLVVDEVFLDYLAEGSGGQTSFAQEQAQAPLTFVLGGLSKTLALPQMKLAWTACLGKPDEVREAMARLEVIADTFLSIATPPQVALCVWLEGRESMQGRIKERVRANLVSFDDLCAGTTVSRLRVDGGWSVVVRVPATEDDTALALRLLRSHGVAVHPGSLYGFTRRGWLVLSLIVPPDVFRSGLACLLSAF